MTHPHDFSLLNDLLDGRMGWSAAEELKRRLVEEPELGLAYEELVRLRASLRALPRSAPPADFLAGVRARAGLPPPVAAASAAVPGGPPAGDGDGARASGGGGVLRLRRRLLPLAAAAGLLVGLGLFAVWQQRVRRDAAPPASTADGGPGVVGAAEKPRGRDAADAGSAPAGTEAKPGDPRSAPRPEAAPGATVPRFKGPGDAVPPGLRVPSDEPSPLPGAPPLVAAPRPAATAPGAPGREAPREAGEADPAPSGTGLAAAGGPSSAARRLPRGGGGGEPDANAAPRAKDGVRGTEPGARAPLGAPVGGLAWARAGADDVLVVRAQALDDARADVALLLAAVRGGAGVEGRVAGIEHVVGERAEASRTSTDPAAEDARARDDDEAAAKRAGASGGAADDKARATDSAPALGAFVIEVTEAEWGRLEAALAASASGTRSGSLGARSATPSGGVPATPPSPAPLPAEPATPEAPPAPPAVPTPPTPPATPAAPPATADGPWRAKGEADGADADRPADAARAPRRRVRIVVLPR